MKVDDRRECGYGTAKSILEYGEVVLNTKSKLKDGEEDELGWRYRRTSLWSLEYFTVNFVFAISKVFYIKLNSFHEGNPFRLKLGFSKQRTLSHLHLLREKATLLLLTFFILPWLPYDHHTKVTYRFFI